MKTARTRLDNKKPERFLFDITPVVADKFRRYCRANSLYLNHVFEEMVVDYLIKQGEITSRQDILVEEQMSK